ncbi:ABC transporter ATP-binding protein [Streptomyces roseolilacinus]|uniref:ABC transporter ATP-binding protein n=1 Tax=Streptomyces roseolilacinus TaxID=66904 RepID=A0A918B0I0_9ACTN|nr:ABC transporter ATP-binding protein [Streptomyces roseolilacinus]GGP95972.1 ABC transporter ATP-binding protein [Streptomyces roseolilacinus]
MPATRTVTSDPARTADRVLLAATRHSAGHAAAILVCSLASAAAALAEPAVLGHTLDLLLAGDARAPRWAALCAVLITADLLLDAAVAQLTGVANARTTAWLRTRSLDRLLRAAPHHAARFAPGDLATRLTANATEAGTVPATAAAAVASVLPPLGALVALFLIDWRTAAAFLAGVPLLWLLLRAFAAHSSDSVARYQAAQARIADRLVEALTGAGTVAAAGTAARERRRVLAPLPELAEEGRRMWRVYGSAVARSGVLLPTLVCLVLAVGGLRLAAGAIGVGDLLAVSRYAALAAGVGAVAGLLGALVRGRSAARRTAEPLTLPPLAHGDGGLPPDGPGTLELRGVTVVRDGSPVLRDVDVVLPGGSRVAVVGRSGAGKSVFAAVAGRLTDPDEGRVLLDGVPLDAVDERTLRREVGYAFARPALFGATVAQALAFGAYAPAGPAVRAAARAAGADGFVQRLPGGYDTPLARAPLSGGELQRLGLARAFAHAGRLLVLDDATSSLDTVTEREVERALARDVRPGTRLVVAHRLSSASRADLVVWLDGGRVRAVGPHPVLWEDPAYRAVFAAAPPPDAPAPGGGAARGPASGGSAR